jgi:hypothetical protein
MFRKILRRRIKSTLGSTLKHGIDTKGQGKAEIHWGNLQTVFSSRSRLEKIANDIIFDLKPSRA